MARNVTYSVSPRVNPNDKEAAPKYYAHVQASGDVNLREMSERIQQSCTVHKSDVFAVLVALEDVMTDALKSGGSLEGCESGTAVEREDTDRLKSLGTSDACQSGAIVECIVSDGGKLASVLEHDGLKACALTERALTDRFDTIGNSYARYVTAG